MGLAQARPNNHLQDLIDPEINERLTNSREFSSLESRTNQVQYLSK